MTTAEQLAAIESDRKKREAALSLMLLAIADQARRHATQAIRHGTDPIERVRDVVYGNAKLGLAGSTGLFAASIADARQAGRRRYEGFFDKAPPDDLEAEYEALKLEAMPDAKKHTDALFASLCLPVQRAMAAMAEEGLRH